VCLGTIIGKLSTFSCIDAFATNLRNDTNLNVGSPYIIPGLLKIDMVWIGDVGWASACKEKQTAKLADNVQSLKK